MAHDTQNTRGGRVGFVVTLVDGTVIREDAATWDDVPQAARVRSLAIVDFRLGVEFVRLEHFERYACLNVGSSTRGGNQAGTHVGKVLVGSKGGRAQRVLLDFTGGEVPRASQDAGPEEAFGYAPHAWREGAVG